MLWLARISVSPSSCAAQMQKLFGDMGAFMRAVRGATAQELEEFAEPRSLS